MSATNHLGSDEGDQATISVQDDPQHPQGTVNPIYIHEEIGQQRSSAATTASMAEQPTSEQYTTATLAAVQQWAAIQSAANSNAAAMGNASAGGFPNLVSSQFQDNSAVASIQIPYSLTNSAMVHAWNLQQQHSLPADFLASTLSNPPHIQQNALHLDALAGFFGAPIPSSATTVPPWLLGIGASRSMWAGGPQGFNASNPQHTAFHSLPGSSLSLPGMESTMTSTQGAPVVGRVANPPLIASSSPSNSIVPTNRPPIVLYTELDEQVLNEYQCMLRKQIELFENGIDDVKGKAQGRNNPIVVGQVGIRCRHCVGLPKAGRSKGAVYYSRTLPGMYQVAQVMAKIHFGADGCKRVPMDVREQLAELKVSKRKPTGGKEYWVHCLTAAGVYEDGQTLRFKPLNQLSQQPQRQERP